MPLSQDLNEFTLIVSGLSGSRGFTNNTTPVMVVPPPALYTFHMVEPHQFSIVNTDTRNATITTFISGSDGTHVIDKITLLPGDKWVSDVPVIINELSSAFYVKLNTSVLSNQLNWNVVYNEIDKE